VIAFNNAVARQKLPLPRSLPEIPHFSPTPVTMADLSDLLLNTVRKDWWLQAWVLEI